MIDNSYAKLVHEELKNIDSEAVYISKPEYFETEYDLLLSSFRKYNHNVNIAYSFKTNYNPNFLNIVKNKKGYAEVVSVMELELALRVGFAPEQIFFNGPFKHKKETLEFLSLGVLVNLDSYDEFIWIEEFANESKTKCRIGIRLNFNLHENPSRFGISVDDKSIQKIINKSISSKYLSFESLHYHYAPRELSIWKNCAEEFVSFLDSLDMTIISKIKFISLGGGMFSRMDDFIRKQLPFDIPDFDEYAYNSVKYIVDYFNSKPDLSTIPEILIEPGTALASKALDFAAKVVSIKNIRNEFYLNTSASKYNMNPSPNRINSPVEVYNSNINNAIYIKKAKISGYTCIESDIIHDNFSGLVANGDTIIFKEVGAYSLVMKPPFILPDVAIIQFNQAKNSFDLIREKQTFNHVFQNFIF
jgi:diaminopimelate decarboxylase